MQCSYYTLIHYVDLALDTGVASLHEKRELILFHTLLGYTMC